MCVCARVCVCVILDKAMEAEDDPLPNTTICPPALHDLLFGTWMEITGAYLDKRWDDCINGFRDDLEAVLTVLTQNTSTHECEDGHDVMQHQCLQQQKQHQVISTDDLATKTPQSSCYDVWSW